MNARKEDRTDVSVLSPPRTAQFRTHKAGVEPLNSVELDPPGKPSTSTQPQRATPDLNDKRMYKAKYCGSFKAFLGFAGVKPGDKLTRGCCEEAGYEIWTDFKPSASMSMNSLVQKKFKDGIAGKLISAHPRFASRVAANIEFGGWRVIEE